MLRYAIIFAVIALVAGALGFGYLADTSATFAKIFAGIFLVLAILGLLFGRRAPAV